MNRTVVVVRFPARCAAAVWLLQASEGGWLVLARAHGWLFGSLVEARSAARWLSRNLGLPIRELVA